MRRLTAKEAHSMSIENGCIYGIENLITHIHLMIRQLSRRGEVSYIIKEGAKNEALINEIRNEFEPLGYEVYRNIYSVDLNISWRNA